MLCDATHWVQVQVHAHAHAPSFSWEFPAWQCRGRETATSPHFCTGSCIFSSFFFFFLLKITFISVLLTSMKTHPCLRLDFTHSPLRREHLLKKSEKPLWHSDSFWLSRCWYVQVLFSKGSLAIVEGAVRNRLSYSTKESVVMDYIVVANKYNHHSRNKSHLVSSSVYISVEYRTDDCQWRCGKSKWELMPRTKRKGFCPFHQVHRNTTERQRDRETDSESQTERDRDIQTERDTHRGRERECVCLNTLGHGGGGKIMEG